MTPILIESVSVVPITDSSVITIEPPVRTPVVEIDEPVSIVPKPDVIEPPLRAKIVVKFEGESISDSIIRDYFCTVVIVPWFNHSKESITIVNAAPISVPPSMSKFPISIHHLKC